MSLQRGLTCVVTMGGPGLYAQTHCIQPVAVEYMKMEGSLFVIIKGNSFTTVPIKFILWNPEDSVEWNKMSSFCQGGDHYLYTQSTGKLVIVKGNVYHAVSNLYATTTTGYNAIQSEMRDGLYYYGLADNMYVIHELTKDSTNLGTVHTKTCLFKDTGTSYY